MRKTFSKEIERLALSDDKLVFVTGDLGFNAFENLQQILGDRFINAGVAEQHMIGMAAGLAAKGHHVFVYSIAPFLVYRALEQIRNDICFHELPVCLVGNGGGYGYGIMGSSHHALSDVGMLSSLPNMKAYVPAFDNDVTLHLEEITKYQSPSYLRLGYGGNQEDYDHFESVQNIHLSDKAQISVAVMGPVLNNIVEHPEWNLLKEQVDLFSVQQYPIVDLHSQLELSLQKTKKLLVAEEHIRNGGLAQQLSVSILEKEIQLNSFTSNYALGYPNKVYGDQKFHQKESKLDGDSLIAEIRKMISND